MSCTPGYKLCAFTTDSPLWMLKGEGTATDRKNHHRHLTEVPFIHRTVPLVCKGLLRLLPKPLYHSPLCSMNVQPCNAQM